PRIMNDPAHKNAPIESYRTNRRRPMRVVPASGDAMAFNPGTNFATSSMREPLRPNLSCVRRTQESGSSETLQIDLRTPTPLRRPSVYQIKSLIVAPSTAHTIATPRFMRCDPASAPAASSSGVDGTGTPACSANTQANTTRYP